MYCTPSHLLKYAQTALFVQGGTRGTYSALIVIIKIHFHAAKYIFLFLGFPTFGQLKLETFHQQVANVSLTCHQHVTNKVIVNFSMKLQTHHQQSLLTNLFSIC